MRFFPSVLMLVLAASFIGRALSQEPEGDHGFPCACPLWEIFQFEDGTLYYCDYFQTNCGNEPSAAYVIGQYPWPMTCPACVTAKHVSDVPIKFSGLEATHLKGPIEPDADFSLPPGPAARFSEVSAYPPLRYIKFMDVRRQEIRAKVFSFLVYPGKALGDPANTTAKLMLIALQIKGDPPATPTDITCEPCKPLEETGTCCAYRAVYSPAPGQRIPILVLTGR